MGILLIRMIRNMYLLSKHCEVLMCVHTMYEVRTLNMTHFINNIGMYIFVYIDIGIHICEAPKTVRVSKLKEGFVNCVGSYIA